MCTYNLGNLKCMVNNTVSGKYSIFCRYCTEIQFII